MTSFIVTEVTRKFQNTTMRFVWKDGDKVHVRFVNGGALPYAVITGVPFADLNRAASAWMFDNFVR